MALLNEADKVYFGALEADRVYLGATLVWEPAGLSEEVIDPANLTGGAEDFSGAPWGVVCVVVVDDTTNPNGDMTADRCTAGAMGFAGCYQYIDYTAATHRMTCRFKRINWDFVCLDFVNGGWGATFDLATGTVSYEAAGATASIVALADGWYRCSIEYTTPEMGQYPEWYFSGSGGSMDRGRSTGGTVDDAVWAWGFEVVGI